MVCLGLLSGTRALAADDDLPPAMIPATPSADQDKTPPPAAGAEEATPGKAVATDSAAPQTVVPGKKEIEKKEPEKQGPAKAEPEKQGREPKAAVKAPARKAPPKKELTAAQVELRDRVRRTLASQGQQPFNTRDNTAADLIKFCWGFGCRSEVEREDSPGQKINAITCLCWDLPCGGYHLLAMNENRIAARVGYGLQDDPSQFLAMLANAYVPSSYPLRVGQTVRTVADLVESEKRGCRAGTDMSLKLIGLSYYAGQATWKNSLDETWSVERMVTEELARPPVAGPRGITRLLGLSCALNQRVKSKQPLDGSFARAKKFVDDYQKYVLQTQNGDGSWTFRLGAGRPADSDFALQFLATGQIAEWLAVSLPARKLEDPALVRSIEYLDSVLNSERYRWNVQALSSQEITAVEHAARALVVYNARVFAPADVETPSPGEKGKGSNPVVTADGQAGAAVRQ